MNDVITDAGCVQLPGGRQSCSSIDNIEYCYKNTSDKSMKFMTVNKQDR
jgi:hypothetical protein